MSGHRVGRLGCRLGDCRVDSSVQRAAEFDCMVHSPLTLAIANDATELLVWKLVQL